MARKQQSINFEHLIISPKNHDVIVICFQECKKSKNVQFIERLMKHMKDLSFDMFAEVSMWEMMMIGFVK